MLFSLFTWKLQFWWEHDTTKNVTCNHEICHQYPLKMQLVTMKYDNCHHQKFKNQICNHENAPSNCNWTKFYIMKVVNDKSEQYIIQWANNVIMSLSANPTIFNMLYH